MKGLAAHLLMTLRLNFRARQAVVYGYLVPVFFLVAFGSVFRSSVPPLLHEMGQLITITILGGACFGMPTAMVSERERGVWRRYRLLPGSTAGLVVSAMVARYLIVLLAVVMQFALAWCLYRTPPPAHPLGELVAFSAACFAFLGMGLMIAMLAGAVPAVQALGQAIFLPMIMIGGVGVPLRALPVWARHVAGFLPGRYAVEALDASYLPGGPGLAGSFFALMALAVIGIAACVAGSRMFRWDAGQKLPRSAMPWIALALAAWAGVGLVADRTGRLALPLDAKAHEGPISNIIAPSTAGNSSEPWRNVTPAEIAAVNFDQLPPDSGVVAPIADNLDDLPADSKERVAKIAALLDHWPPGQVPDIVQRVRNLLSAAAVFDVLEDPDEGAVARVILDDIRRQAPDDELKRILTYIIDHPDSGAVLTRAQALGAQGQITEGAARERMEMYAAKLLERVLGKVHDSGNP
ncbi:MAG TPA: ABC transporter permease [Chthoniobacteraceae bacterium]|jgi:ABC-2 type transport system permease protein|nr:ABC transporter permease [Chthoniobacteraceae bacterium]